MERMKIAALFADQEQLDGKEVTVCGWAHHPGYENLWVHRAQ